MNEDFKYRKLKAGQTPIADPGAKTTPFITEEGYLLVSTKTEFTGGASTSTPQILNLDDTGTYTYVGTADMGSADSDVAWTLKRVTNATGAIRYPSNYPTKNTWTGRADIGLTYE